MTTSLQDGARVVANVQQLAELVLEHDRVQFEAAMRLLWYEHVRQRCADVWCAWADLRGDPTH